MKRRTVLAIVRAEKRARYKGGQQVQSKYGLKRRSLFETIPFPYTEWNCPDYSPATDPSFCSRCGVSIHDHHKYAKEF